MVEVLIDQKSLCLWAFMRWKRLFAQPSDRRFRCLAATIEVPDTSRLLAPASTLFSRPARQPRRGSRRCKPVRPVQGRLELQNSWPRGSSAKSDIQAAGIVSIVFAGLTGKANIPSNIGAAPEPFNTIRSTSVEIAALNSSIRNCSILGWD